jgi:branched-chain amino acid transport system substrate-binding protein
VVVGSPDWSNGPVKNVTKTPLVGGHGRRGTDHPNDRVVGSDSDHPEIAKAGRVVPVV